MQISVEDVSSVKKMLHIEIPQDTIVRELDRAYEDLKKRVKLKGFRPGKAPRGVLERYFKKDVHADVSSKLIQESLVSAVKENDLKIVGKPQIDPPALDEASPYKYSATVEIRPEIGDINIQGLKFTKTRYQATPEEVEKQLGVLRKNLAKHEPIEDQRPLAEGDFAVIDYEGFRDGKPYPELKRTENFMMKIGDGAIAADLDEKVIGMKPGDRREVPISFPEDHFNKKLAGLEITFDVTLKEIRKELLPELDDEFAKKMGRYETLADLEKAITDNLNQGYRRRTEQEMNEQIYEALLSQREFEVPDAMVAYELENIVSDAERYFANHNLQLEQAGLTRAKLSEQYRDLAVKQVKRHLVLNRVIEQQNLTLTDEEWEAGFTDMAGAFQQSVEEIKAFYRQSEDRLEGFKQVLLEKKAIRLIIDNSEVEEKDPETAEDSKTETD